MIYPSITRAGTLLNGVAPDQTTALEAGLAFVPFTVNQKDVLTLGFHATSFVRLVYGDSTNAGFNVYFDGVAMSGRDQDTAAINVTDKAVLLKQAQTLNLSATSGQESKAPYAVKIDNFQSIAGKTHHFMVAGGYTGAAKSGLLYVKINASTITVYETASMSTAVATKDPGRAFLNTDSLTIRYTPTALEVLFNDDVIYTKNRFWKASVSSANLGVLSSTANTSTDQTLTLTVGQIAGTYSITIEDQDGNTAVQSIVVSADVTTPATPTVPLATVAALAAVQNQAFPQTPATDIPFRFTPGQVVALALGTLLIVGGIVWYVTSHRNS